MFVKKVLTLFKDLDTEGRSGEDHHHDVRTSPSSSSSPSSDLGMGAEKTSQLESVGDGGSDTISGYHSDSDHSNNPARNSPLTNNDDSTPSIVNGSTSSNDGITESNLGEDFFAASFLSIFRFIFLTHSHTRGFLSPSSSSLPPSLFFFLFREKMFLLSD